MPIDLRLRRTYEDSDEFWSVYADGVCVGAIMKRTGAPASEPPWSWSNTVGVSAVPLDKNGVADSREAAMAAFRDAWAAFRPYIGDDVWWWWVAHAVEVDKRSTRKNVDPEAHERLAERVASHGIPVKHPPFAGTN